MLSQRQQLCHCCFGVYVYQAVRELRLSQSNQIPKLWRKRVTGSSTGGKRFAEAVNHCTLQRRG